MAESPSTGRRMVRCPACQGPSSLDRGNVWRPFCSERCRQIDTGAWASEAYRVEARPPAAPEAGEDWER